MLALVTLVMVVAVAGLTWTLVQNQRSEVVTGDVVADTSSAGVEDLAVRQAGTGVRAADAFSADLDGLRRQASMVASRDSATAHVMALEALAQAGRQAYVNGRLPTAANDYVLYLDTLRRQGQVVTNVGSAPAGADAFSQWLDELRRLSQ